jgi:16S rRNA (cytidine1402-2'-O)-methyltransferase
MTGKLFVVSTPIGNMGDSSSRSLEILKSVSYVAAEDTREMGKLFALNNIPKPEWISYRDQNHAKAVTKILGILKGGSDIALTSDRGTPTISDPGYKLVRDALEEGIEVISIPGPSALVAALSISGLPTDKFTFLGFLPRTKGKQKKILQEFGQLQNTLIMYESPYRVRQLLENILETLGDIDTVAVKEITKVHEQVIRGTTSQILSQLESTNLKGEWVVLCRS